MSAADGRALTNSCLYHAALYMRLSKDDDGMAESASIATQRKILRAYACKNNYIIADEYIDDGWSGTNFDRPNFKRMLQDIEAGRVNMVITKDFSRLGRDYITTGQYTEIYFPEHEVRYVAVNDGYDSDDSDNDVAPFKHVINEMYARDTSKKIRSAFKARMLEGSYIGNFAPYGYQKDADNKNRLIVDHEAAPVVREIFMLAAADCRPSEIAERLNQNGIVSPAIYRCSSRPHLDVGAYTKRGKWTSSTICKILANIVYLGHTAQGKTTKPSFRSKAVIRRPRGEWCVVEDTHEPIIAREIFDLARKRSVSRRNAPKTGFSNVFSGVAKCADCGGNMSTTSSRKKDSPYNLVCGRYKLYGKGECSNHFIDYGFLYESVLSEVREMLTLSENEKKRILADMEKIKLEKLSKGAVGETANLLRKLEKRDREIDVLIRRLYEDNASGKVSDGRFAKLSDEYEDEQREISCRIKMLKKPDTPKTDTQASRRSFSEIIDGLSDISALTPNLIKRLIDRIEVSQGGYEQTPEGKKKRQAVRIFWQTNDICAIEPRGIR